MPTCDDIRTLIAIGDTATPSVQTHLADCTACTRYAHGNEDFDQHVASRLHHTPSAQLTAQLLAIATDHALPAPRHARTWWAPLIVFMIGVVAVGFSVLLSAQIVLLFSGASAYHSYAHAIVTAPDYLYNWITSLPTLGAALVTLNTMRIQLIIMLVVGLVLFGYYTQRAQNPQNRSK